MEAALKLLSTLGSAVWAEPASVAAVVRGVRHELDDHTDPALHAIAALADNVARRWVDKRNEVDRFRDTISRAESELNDLQRMAMTVVRTLQELLATTRNDAPKRPRQADDPSPAEGPVTVAAEAGALPDVLDVRLFGPFRLSFRGAVVESWHGAKAARVARYLFSQAPRQIGREAMVELFWPEVDPEPGRRALHQAVYQIRKALRSVGFEACVVYTNETYGIDPACAIRCDVNEFELSIGAARRAERDRRTDEALTLLRAAEALYVGDLLEDSPYEEWAARERDRLRLLYLEGANHLADLLVRQDNHDEALEVSQRILGREPADESAHRRAIHCFGTAGQRNLVIRQFQSCAETLERDFGLSPSAETKALYDSFVS